VYYRDRAVSTRIRALIDFLRDHVQQLPKELS
ncbi:LysR family transcriptional regulator, partial [Klebsiella pneumoniae]|nr:LysR family transcriptional regulator [Klebsiella pneumoniae]